MTFRPMLAGTVDDIARLPYPMIASPKLDGIRCIVRGGKALSRTLKQIPNAYVRATLEALQHAEGLDGELLSGSNFSECSSAIMSRDGAPDFSYWVFDNLADPAGYRHRIAMLDAQVAQIEDPRVVSVPTVSISNVAELEAYEADMLARGFEGVMLRAPDGPYKYGRSTLREAYLLKLKRFLDFEAQVIDFEELVHNTNAATTDNLGRTKRSSAAEGLVPGGTLGKLILRRLSDDCEFGCGAGLTDALRAEVWANREAYLGRTAKIKSQPYGEKDAPRLPVFLGWRASEDVE